MKNKYINKVFPFSIRKIIFLILLLFSTFISAQFLKKTEGIIIFSKDNITIPSDSSNIINTTSDSVIYISNGAFLYSENKLVPKKLSIIPKKKLFAKKRTGCNIAGKHKRNVIKETGTSYSETVNPISESTPFSFKLLTHETIAVGNNPYIIKKIGIGFFLMVEKYLFLIEKSIFFNNSHATSIVKPYYYFSSRPPPKYSFQKNYSYKI